MPRKKKEKKRIFSTVCLIFYTFVLLFVLLCMGRAGSESYRYNLIPFDEIRRYIKYRHLVGNITYLKNIWGNILIFIPFGFFWCIRFPKLNKISLVLLISLELSLFVEVTQLITTVGSFDVDDLILNTLGGVIGALLYRIITWRK